MNTTTQLIVYYYNPQLAGMQVVSICLCLLALASVLAFQAQRRFPINIVAVITVLDTFYCIFQLVINVGDFSHTNVSRFCAIVLAGQVFFSMVSLTLNTLLAFITYNLLKRSQKMSTDQYLWIFCALTFVVGVFYPLLVVLSSCSSGECSCHPSRAVGIYALFIPFIILVIVQLTLISITLHHIYHISKRVAPVLTAREKKARRKDVFLYFRLAFIVFLQAYQWIFPFIVFGFGFGFNDPNASQETLQFNFELRNYMLDSGYLVGPLVILVCNRSLLKFLTKKWTNYRRRTLSAVQRSESGIPLTPNKPRHAIERSESEALPPNSLGGNLPEAAADQSSTESPPPSPVMIPDTPEPLGV